MRKNELEWKNRSPICRRNASHCWLTAYSSYTCSGQRHKAVEGCLQREIVWSIITTCQLPRHVAYQWVVYRLQRFKGHKRALYPALKPGKQHHSKAKDTLGGTVVRTASWNQPMRGILNSLLQPNISTNSHTHSHDFFYHELQIEMFSKHLCIYHGMRNHYIKS